MNERFNPKNYIEDISKIFYEALKNGLAIEIVNNKVSICNTVAEEKATIDFTPWSDEEENDLFEDYKITEIKIA